MAQHTQQDQQTDEQQTEQQAAASADPREPRLILSFPGGEEHSIPKSSISSFRRIGSEVYSFTLEPQGHRLIIPTITISLHWSAYDFATEIYDAIREFVGPRSSISQDITLHLSSEDRLTSYSIGEDWYYGADEPGRL